MGGPKRSRRQKPSAPCVPTSPQASSGSTLPDDGMNVARRASEYSHAHVDSRIGPLFNMAGDHTLNNSRGSSDSSTVHSVDPLGENIKEVIQTISRLEGLGLQRQNIPMPKCVVSGMQSAGKSSVIEAISGIKTPRNTGTCTRCPLFISMQSSSNTHGHWEAHIVLRLMFSYDGRQHRKFPGWNANHTPDEVEFAITRSADALEKIIERAQLAVLNPGQKPSIFLGTSVPVRNQCQFSPNVVCIYISAPDLPSLAFYDLPGIIGDVEQEEDRHLIQFVKDLVEVYITDKDSIILATCSLDADFSTSATGLVRDWKAADRCIGVITKPDRLNRGSCNDENQLRRILDGECFRLGHGYFVVKNPDQESLKTGITHRDARFQEQEFFDTTHPWSSPDFQAHRGRFGTLNLQSYLSKLLAEQAVKRSPVIADEIDSKLAEIEQQLRSLPETPSHQAVRIVSDLSSAFATNVYMAMEGEHDHDSWKNTWDCLRAAFLEGLESLKPTLRIRGRLDQGIYKSSLPGQSANDSILIDSGDEEGEHVQIADRMETPSKKRKLEDNSYLSTPIKKTTRREPRASKPDCNPFSQRFNFSDKRLRFDLDDLAAYLEQKSSSDVSDRLHPKVVGNLMIEAVQNFDLPVQAFFEQFERGLKTLMRTLFHKHFGQRQDCPVYSAAWHIVENMVDLNLAEQRDMIAAHSLNHERTRPYIFPKVDFIRFKEETLDLYRTKRRSVRLNVYMEEAQAQAGREMTAKDKEKLAKDDCVRALCDKEPYRTEIEVASEVVAYFRLATRRLHDAICHPIDMKLLQALRTDLRDEIHSGLLIFDDEKGPEKAQALLQEDQARQNRRRELRETRDSLRQGQALLKQLVNKYGVTSQAGVAGGDCSLGSACGMESASLTEEVV